MGLMKLKLALLGKGKTGSKVLELFPTATVFDSKNPPNLNELKRFDVIISFLPGEVFKKYIPMLLKTKIPLVIGSTGFDFPKNINQKLRENKVLWVKSSNFALGMLLIKPMIEEMGKIEEITDDFSFSLSETHHIKKLDSPSGTALSWKDWLGKDVAIASKREGDELGTHNLTLKTPFEEITLTHRTLDRKIFAQGALIAAKKVLKSKKKGLLDFRDLFL
jgi:4-hydroxy-tetrahydrodipicolinate reductase